MLTLWMSRGKCEPEATPEAMLDAMLEAMLEAMPEARSMPHWSRAAAEAAWACAASMYILEDSR